MFHGVVGLSCCGATLRKGTLTEREAGLSFTNIRIDHLAKDTDTIRFPCLGTRNPLSLKSLAHGVRHILIHDVPISPR